MRKQEKEPIPCIETTSFGVFPCEKGGGVVCDMGGEGDVSLGVADRGLWGPCHRMRCCAAAAAAAAAAAVQRC